MRRWLPILLGFALLTPAAQPGEDLYNRLAAELVAPCCWQESLTLHRSPAADEARAELRGLIAEGRSEEEIREAFVARYGERVLITPRGGKSDALFWPPLLAFAAGLAIAAFFLSRLLRRARRASRPAPAGGPSVEIDDRDLDW